MRMEKGQRASIVASVHLLIGQESEYMLKRKWDDASFCGFKELLLSTIAMLDADLSLICSKASKKSGLDDVAKTGAL